MECREVQEEKEVRGCGAKHTQMKQSMVRKLKGKQIAHMGPANNPVCPLEHGEDGSKKGQSILQKYRLP